MCRNAILTNKHYATRVLESGINLYIILLEILITLVGDNSSEDAVFITDIFL